MHAERRPHGEAAADREGRRHLAEAEVDPKRHERHVGEEDQADFGAAERAPAREASGGRARPRD